MPSAPDLNGADKPEPIQNSDPLEVTTADAPLAREELREALDALPPGERIENVLAQLSLAARSVAFARVAAPRLQVLEGQRGNTPVASGLNHLIISVLRAAVLDTAAMIDQTGEGSNSIPTVLNILKRKLKDSPPSAERRAALDLVLEIRTTSIETRTPELDYVRYLRNKWAAHSTLDRSVDPWEPGKIVDFTKLESALEQMQAHFLDLARLAGQVTALQSLEADGRKTGENTIRIGLGWEGFGSDAVSFMGELGENSAGQLLDRIEFGFATWERD